MDRTLWLKSRISHCALLIEQSLVSQHRWSCTDCRNPDALFRGIMQPAVHNRGLVQVFCSQSAARQNQHFHFLFTNFFCGNVAQHRNPVGTGDDFAAVHSRIGSDCCGLNLYPCPTKQIDRSQCFHLFKSICKKYGYHKCLSPLLCKSN